MSSVRWTGCGLRVGEVRSHYRVGSWLPPFESLEYGVSLPLSGRYLRRVDGVDHLVSRTCGFFKRRGSEIEVAHPFDEPDALTVIDIDPVALGLTEPEDWPSGPRMIEPRVGLAHRVLRRELGRGADDLRIEEQVLDLVRAFAAGIEPIAAPRSRSERERRALIGDVTEVIHDRAGQFTLVALARKVGCSPFHLSRTFRDITGLTLSQYRTRLRVHEVIHHLDEGADDLTALALACGFADHSHMTRTVVAHVGETPSRIRALLSRAS